MALGTFATKGFHATSMHEIAVAAGVTKPVLYQHFASKRDLYLELLQDVSDRLLSAITSAVEAVAAPAERVEAGFRAYFRFVADQPDAFRLLFGGGARRDEEFADKVRQVELTIAAATAAWIEADIDDDHRALLGHGLVGLAEGTSRHWVAAGLDVDPDLLARRVTDLAWAGLRGIRRVDALSGPSLSGPSVSGPSLSGPGHTRPSRTAPSLTRPGGP